MGGTKIGKGGPVLAAKIGPGGPVLAADRFFRYRTNWNNFDSSAAKQTFKLKLILITFT